MARIGDKSTRTMSRTIRLWCLFGLVATCGLLYWIYSHDFAPSMRNDDKVRQRFAMPSLAMPHGHSPIALPALSRSAPIDRQIENLEPGRAGWESETISDDIAEQLHRVRLAIESDSNDRETRIESACADIVAGQFDGMILSENQLQTIDNDGTFLVQRLPAGYSNFLPTDSLAAVITFLVGTNSSERPRCSLKITQIETQDDLASTGATLLATSRVLFQSLSKTNDGLLQSNAVIDCQWQLDSQRPRLCSLKILEFERIVYSAADQTMFDDVTAAVFDNNSAHDRRSDDDTTVFEEQVLRDVGYWCERLSAIDDMSIYGHHGLSIGDVNQDGLEDVYVCDSGGLPNRLFLQMPDGTLRDASRQSNADWLESTSSSLLIDLENDGDPDLVAATVAGLIVAANNGEGVFKIRAAIPGLSEAQSICAADYDNDGDLDIYVTVYGPGGSAQRQRGFEAAVPIPYHDANNGGSNVLYQNQGDFHFVDVTTNAGLDVNNHRFSFAAAWEDFDGDGDMDLYVANDFGRNNLYENNDGVFHDIAAKRNVEDMAGGMSVSWGDCNQDGFMDIYVGNMYSAAGNRVTYQRRFLAGRGAESLAGIQRMTRGNTLFMAKSGEAFTDVSQTAGVMMGRWAWSSSFADLNNDSREDLVVANGYISNNNADDL